MPGCPPALGARKDKSRVVHLQGGGLPVGMTPAKATGLTGATARRGRAGHRGAASAFTLPQTLLPYSRWRPGPVQGPRADTTPRPWRVRADFHSQKALLFNRIFVAGKVL